MLSSVEQLFVGRDEKRAPLKMPAWEATCTDEPLGTGASLIRTPVLSIMDSF